MSATQQILAGLAASAVVLPNLGTIACRYNPSDPAGYTLSGSDITALNDVSGNARHATLSSTKPTRSAGAFGSRAGIVTAAGSSYFAMPSSVITAIGDSFTLGLVVKPNTTGGYIVLFDTAGRELSLFYTSSGTQLSYYGLGGYHTSTSGGTMINNAGNIIVVRFSSAGASGGSFYVNGGSAITVTTDTMTAEEIRFGANPSGGGTQPNGTYGEPIMYDSDIGETNVRKFEGYLAHSHGLAGNLPGGHPYKSSPP